MKLVHVRQNEFDDYNRAHPEVFDHYVTYARWYLALNYTDDMVGSKHVTEHIRPNLKKLLGIRVPNTYTPLWSRKAEVECPDLAGKFTMRGISTFNLAFVEDHDPRPELIYPFGRKSP